MSTKPVFADIAAWPEPTAAPAHTGHNKPPLDELVPVEFRAELLREQPEFLTVLHNLVDAADRCVVTDDESLGKAGDLVKRYRALLTHITDTHKAVKDPYLTGGRLVDAEKNQLAGQVEEAKRRVEAIGNAFVAEKTARENAERARIEREQREAAAAAELAERNRRAAELAAEQAALSGTNDAECAAAVEAAAQATAHADAAAAAAALAPAAPTRAEPVRSDGGATVSGKQEWRSQVTDYTVAFIAVEDNQKVREAIDKAIAGLVRAGKREIEGCRIWPVATANFR